MRNTKWTVDALKEDALQYKTRMDWKKNSKGYATAVKHGVLNECCTHMTRPPPYNKKWSEDALKEDALKYKTRVEWRTKHSSAYSIAHKLGIVDECCKHMVVVGSREKRCIYVIMCNGYVYVGLTQDYTTRMYQHTFDTNGIIYHFNKLYPNSQIGHIQLTDYIDVEDACQLENEILQEYIDMGIKTANRTKAGGVGGSVLKWTLEALREDALKYNTRTEWARQNSGAYDACWKRGMLDECCKHMPKPKKQWTVDALKKDALRYNTRGEWQKNSSGAYSAAYKKDLVDECCKHMF